ncbi:MAG TPA: DUF2520 domain-containing protein [Pyrinomonadaceae bacterium]
MLERGAAARVDASGAGKRKATVSVIGAGRLGTALAAALARRGYLIEAVVTRRRAHALRAARSTGTNPRALTVGELAQLPPSDILLITTPDDAISATAARLAETIRTAQRGRTALHASGALSSSALGALGGAGFATGSMHPLVSVSGRSGNAPESFRAAYFCVEGDARALRVARALVRDLEGRSFSIDRGKKALYHAAAVMASGHMVALFELAAGLLARCGLTEAGAQRVLLPLVRSTVENLSTLEPARALTGTFARADAATVRRHLSALGSSDAQDALALYRLLGLRSLGLAAQAGANPAALEEIAGLLESIEGKPGERGQAKRGGKRPRGRD